MCVCVCGCIYVYNEVDVAVGSCCLALKPLGKTTEDVTDVATARGDLVGKRVSWLGEEWTGAVLPVQAVDRRFVVRLALVVIAAVDARARPAQDRPRHADRLLSCCCCCCC